MNGNSKLKIGVFVVAAVLVLTSFGCSALSGPKEKTAKTEVINTFVREDDFLPARAYSHEGEWVLLLSDRQIEGYGDKYRVSTEQKDSGERKTLFETEPGQRIRDMAVSNELAAWFVCENISESVQTDTLYVCDLATGEVSKAFEKTVDEEKGEHQMPYIGIFGSKVYFLDNDYEKDACRIVVYYTTDSKSEDVVSLPFNGKEGIWRHSITFINMRGPQLVYNESGTDGDTLCVYDAQSKTETARASLPTLAKVIYTADYDANSGDFYVYYCDRDNKDQCGIFKPGDDSVYDFYTLGDYTLLFKDRLEVWDGWAAYVLQYNVSGNVIDHYEASIVHWDKKYVSLLKKCYWFEASPTEFHALLLKDDQLDDAVDYVKCIDWQK